MTNTCLCAKKNQYRNPDDLKCYDCSIVCSSCKGPLISDCKECALGLFLHEARCLLSCPSPLKGNPITFKCECPLGYFVSDQGDCIACQAGCAFCTTDPEKCERCDESKVLYSAKCFSTCPEGTQLDSKKSFCYGKAKYIFFYQFLNITLLISKQKDVLNFVINARMVRLVKFAEIITILIKKTKLAVVVILPSM